jgi:nucleoside-diphosphate-sugar epimerase
VKVLVTGATGFTGASVVRALHASGIDVRCLVRASSDRRPLPLDGVRVSVGDLGDRPSLERALEGAHALMSVASLGFGHAPNLVAAAVRTGVGRAVFFSTTSIFTALEPPTKRARLQAEEEIRASGLAYTILRPTMIYGNGRDRNMARLIRYLQRWPIIPVFGSGRARYQPVHVDDVAAAALACLRRPESEKKVYTLSGASVLALDALIDTVCRLLGRRVAKVHLPAAPVAALMQALERGGLRLPLRAEQILRLEEDKCFDHEDAARDLGYRPRAFEDGIRQEIAALAGGA